MSNMSYCRYRNTLEDLRDCYDDLNDFSNNKEELIADEEQAKNELISLCAEIANFFN